MEIEETEGGETPLHFAVAGGYKDCVLLLTSRFPKLIHKLVALVGQQGIDEGNVYKALEFLAFQHDHLHEILCRLAEITSVSGQLMLSPSADASLMEPKFLTQIRILSRLCLHLMGKKLPNASITFANRDKLKKSNIFIQETPTLNITSFDLPQISDPPPPPSSSTSQSLTSGGKEEATASAAAFSAFSPQIDIYEAGPSNRVRPEPEPSLESFSSSATGESGGSAFRAAPLESFEPIPLSPLTVADHQQASTGGSGSVRMGRSISISGMLTFSRRATKGKRKAIETGDHEITDEKKKAIMKEGLLFLSCLVFSFPPPFGSRVDVLFLLQWWVILTPAGWLSQSGSISSTGTRQVRRWIYMLTGSPCWFTVTTSLRGCFDYAPFECGV